jgi:hypothetical protein
MPLPFEGGDENDRVPKFSDSELSIILQKSCLCSWRDAQVTAHLKYNELNSTSKLFLQSQKA